MQATGAYWKTTCSQTYFFSSFRFLLSPLPPAFSGLTVKYEFKKIVIAGHKPDYIFHFISPECEMHKKHAGCNLSTLMKHSHRCLLRDSPQTCICLPLSCLLCIFDEANALVLII